MHPDYFSFQTESFCNGPETEVKCKIGLRPYIIYAFFIHKQLALSLFLNKILCDRTYQGRACVCVCVCVCVLVFWLKTFRNCVIYQSLWLFLCKGWGRERGTQQENSYAKYAVTDFL